jgi:hypothetical protein
VALTPEQRTTRARMAAYAMHARNDPKATTAAARRRFADRFRPPDCDALGPSECERRARAALRAHMSGLALKSSKARSKW